MRKNDVLIMKNASVPTVIAECGFLSNQNEAALLVKAEYQEQLAEAMKQGILAYLGIDENEAEKLGILRRTVKHPKKGKDKKIGDQRLISRKFSEIISEEPRLWIVTIKCG